MLLLLHGAIGSASQLQPLAENLGNPLDVQTLNFDGHGGTEFPEEDFSIELFAGQVLRFVEQNTSEPVDLFGYSMGGYVAMYLAKKFPLLVKSVATLATKFYWEETVAENEIKKLDPEVIIQKVPAFAETLKQRHAPSDWRIILRKTGEMMRRLGRNNILSLEDYKTIAHPVLLMLGDRDKMVTVEETMNVYKALPSASLAILPDTPHPIEQVDLEMLAWHLQTFLNKLTINH